MPVHPTQLYETGGLLLVAWVLLMWRSRGVSDVIVFAGYLVLAGSLRFLIEFIRVNARVAGPFTLAQLISSGIVVVGAGLLAREKKLL